MNEIIARITQTRPVWETPITVKAIEELAFAQLKAKTLAGIRRGI